MKSLSEWIRSAPSWLPAAFRTLEAAGYRVTWVRRGRTLCVLPDRGQYPAVWVDRNGRVDVTPSENQVDHPGYRLERDERSATTLLRILESEGL